MRATIVKAVFGCLAAAGLGSLAAIAACASSADDCLLIGTCVADAGEEGGQVETDGGTEGGTDGGTPPVYSLCDAKRYGDDQEQAALGVLVDPNAGPIVLGTFAGALKLGVSTLTATTAKDMFVIGFNPALSPTWAYSRPVTYLDGAFDPSTSEVIIAGTKTDTVDFGCGPLDATLGFFLLRLDGSGKCKTSSGFAMSPTAVRVAVDNTGNVALAGTFSGQVDVGGSTKLSSSGGSDIFIARYDSALKHVWSGAIGTLGDDAVGGVGFAEGKVVLAGTFNGNLELDGSNFKNDGADVLLAHLDGNKGTILAHKEFITPGDQVVFDIAVDSSGSVTLAGSMLGGGTNFGGQALPEMEGIFLARLDADYKPVFTNGYALKGIAGLGGLAADPDGKVALAGFLKGTIDLGSGSLSSKDEDAFVAMFDAEGKHVLSQRFGDAAAQVASGVAFSGSDLVFSGAFAGTFGALNSAGGDDVFVARLCPKSP